MRHEPAVAPLAALILIYPVLDPAGDSRSYQHFAERLRAAGTPVEVSVYRGAAHGFWWLDGVMRQSAELTEQLARFVGSLRREQAPRSRRPNGSPRA